MLHSDHKTEGLRIEDKQETVKTFLLDEKELEDTKLKKELQ